MDSIDFALLLRAYNSLEAFSEGDDPVSLRDWKAWEAACFAESRTIPPAEFKALPEEERLKYLKTPNVASNRLP